MAGERGVSEKERGNNQNNRDKQCLTHEIIIALAFQVFKEYNRLVRYVGSRELRWITPLLLFPN